jgi:diguanylate cyclase (GGDEF)-like protein
MSLDTPTLFACLVIAGFAGSAILLLFCVYWPDKSMASTRSLAMWSAGMFLAACGTLLIALRGTIPDGLSIIGANFLLILGMGLRRSGVAVFLGQRGHVWLFAVLGTAWLVLSLFPGFQDSFLFRVNYVQSVLILTGVWVVCMAFFQNPERLRSVTLLGVTTLLECAAFAWFTLNQNILLFPSFLSAFPEGFMTVYLATLLFSMIMTIVLPAAMVIEQSFHLFREQAAQNELTGLPNRRSFQDDANNWHRENRRQGENYSVVLFDMEELHAVREKYSPAMGDALLQLFARVLKDALTGNAFSGHFGGTEFAVLLPESDAGLARLTAERICRQFGFGCHEASGGRLMVSVSVGLVTAGGGMRPGRAIQAAERELMKAHKQGRAQIAAVDLTAGGADRKASGKPAAAEVSKKAA